MNEKIIRLRDEISLRFEKLALAGPQVINSPSVSNTQLALIDYKGTLSPGSTLNKNQAFEEPSKKGLITYDKMMIDLESNVSRFIKQLDTQVQEAQEAKEKQRVMQERLQARLKKKQEKEQSAVEKGREALGNWEWI